MDYTACAVPFIGCACFLLGIGFHAWCMREPKLKQDQPPEQEDKHSGLFRDIDEFLSGSGMSEH